MDEFIFELRSCITREQMFELSTAYFIVCNKNIVVIGSRGAGKTYLAKIIEYKYKTGFISAIDLMLQLSTAKRQNKLNEYMNKNIKNFKLLFIDEIEYMSFGTDKARHLFDVIAKRYKQGSVIVTRNLSLSNCLTL